MDLFRWICLLLLGHQVTARKQNLYRHLMNTARYSKRVRPVTNAAHPVNITLGLSLQEIIDLNDKTQLLSLRSTIRHTWMDSSLSWQPSQFGGMKKISLRASDIWVPDIVLYNNAGEGFGFGSDRINAVVGNDGLVILTIPFISQSNCQVQLANYPFDVQVCSIKFGSWSFDASQIALTIESSTADLSTFLPSVEWELVEIPGEFHSVLYKCCDNPYHDIEYMIKIRRRSLFYAMYLIIPCAMISLLSLLVFVLPPECNERMTVGMAILVGLSFFFVLVAENMPATAEAVPLIGIYYTVTLIEISAAFFMTCVVLRCHHHNPVHGEVPDWMKVYVIGIAARLLGFKFSKEKAVLSQMYGNDNKVVSMTNDENKEKDIQITSKNERESQEAEKTISDNIKKQEILEKRQEEWRRAALVFNSIFMWIYIIAIVLSFAILLVPPLVLAM